MKRKNTWIKLRYYLKKSKKMSKEKIKALNKIIKNVEIEYNMAMYNNNFEHASYWKKYKKELLAEKDELEKKLLEG